MEFLSIQSGMFLANGLIHKHAPLFPVCVFFAVVIALWNAAAAAEVTVTGTSWILLVM